MKVAQYVVRSSVHMMNLDSAITRLLDREQFIDVTLACDGKRFQCHRLILAASSPLFEELLMNNPETHPIILIPVGIKSNTLKSVIDFMYKGQTNVSQSGLKELVECAEMLQVTGLYESQTQFREYLQDNVDGTDQATQYDVSFMDFEDNLKPTNRLENVAESMNATSDSDHLSNDEPNENDTNIVEIKDCENVPTFHADDFDDPMTDSELFETCDNSFNESTLTVDQSSEIIEHINGVEVKSGTSRKTMQSESNHKASAPTAVPSIRVKPTIKLMNPVHLIENTPVDGQTKSQIIPISSAVSWSNTSIPSDGTNCDANASLSWSSVQSTWTSDKIESSTPKILPVDPLQLEDLDNRHNPASVAGPKQPPVRTNTRKLNRRNEQKNLPAINIQDQVLSKELESMIFDSPRVVKKEPDSSLEEIREIELGETLLSESNLPVFYAMIKNEQEENSATHSKDISGCTQNGYELKAENIICQPNVSYIYGSDDDGKEIECEDDEAGDCIDYDQLVAETYGSDIIKDETSLFKQQKQVIGLNIKANKANMPPPMYLVRKNSKHKQPAPLLPLSMTNSIAKPRQLYSKKDVINDANVLNRNKMNVETGSDIDDTPKTDIHSLHNVILRNPRYNQPRHYDTDALYSALMAVKNGESIYRATQIHRIPRKTLRNWMKRWNIKSKYPMPKQLKDAAERKKKSQDI